MSEICNINKLFDFFSSTGYQCLTIRKKSDFVLEIKFGKINYDTPDIDCDEMEAISQEFVFGKTFLSFKLKLN